MLVAGSAISVQFGAAIATHLFSEVGPAGAVTLRLTFAAVALLVVNLPKRRGIAVLARRRHDLAVAVVFGVVLGVMNLSFYEAIARVPLGVAVTIEFIGPLSLSLVGSRRLLDGLWALAAGTGVVLLAGGGLFGAVHHLNLVGVGYAALAGLCWAGYVILNGATGRRFSGTSGLALAMVVATVVVLPFGLMQAGTRLVIPGVVGIGMAVALLSSVLPYSLEIYALRRVTARAFGVLLSMDPAFAALAGLLLLGQQLSSSEVIALVLVVLANAGSSFFDLRAIPAPPEP
jgi:inner membrane transporter RhtA